MSSPSSTTLLVVAMAICSVVALPACSDKGAQEASEQAASDGEGQQGTARDGTAGGKAAKGKRRARTARNRSARDRSGNRNARRDRISKAEDTSTSKARRPPRTRASALRLANKKRRERAGVQRTSDKRLVLRASKKQF